MPYYYGYGFGIDPLYLLVVLVCTVLGLVAQNYINSTYKTGPRFARTAIRVPRSLAACSMPTVCNRGYQRVSLASSPIITTRRTTTCICRMPTVRAGRSQALPSPVTSHAAQRQSGYAMMKVRTALVSGCQLYPEHLDHRVALGPCL